MRRRHALSIANNIAKRCLSSRLIVVMAMVMCCHSLVASVTAAFVSVHPSNSRRHLHLAGDARPSPSTRRCGKFRPSFHSNRHMMSTKILASATNSDDADITDDPAAVTGVTLKMAFDSSPVWGVADLSETKSERFTSPESLDMVHRLRRESSAVLVGRATVERDDCTLTVRRVELGDGKVQPVRVILDPSLSLIGGDYAIMKDGLPTIIYHLQTENLDETLKGTSDAVTFVGLSPSDLDNRSSICPLEVVKDLETRGLRHIMLEGGPATALAFLEARGVDRAILVRAPIEFEIPMPAHMDEDTMKRAGLKMIGSSVIGGDNVEYWTRDGLFWPNSDLPMWP